MAALAPGSMPPTLPGFEHIGRIWDHTHKAPSAKILPGEYYVTTNEECITTVLGSCVSACIRDPVTGVGGMNHFMLPGEQGNNSSWGADDGLSTARFGVTAMEMLINEILKQGARKDRLESKLFGGGEILAMEFNNVGARNAAFALEFMATEMLSVAAQDLGGPHPRKVMFFPKTGRCLVRRLRSLQTEIVAAQERQYQADISKAEDDSGDIELFD